MGIKVKPIIDRCLLFKFFIVLFFCRIIFFNIPCFSANINKDAVFISQSNTVITGRHISNPSGPCIIISENIKNVRIEKNNIGPCGKNVDGIGIDVRPGATNINIIDNIIHDVSSGIYVFGALHPIIIEKNTVYNIRGPMPRGQMVQFNHVEGKNGQSRIVRNISDKNMSTNKTSYEDHISMYMSSGTSNYPILISCNKIRGGDSETGSAIMVGDNGGEWFDIRDNIIVFSSNTGIGVSGAKNVTVQRNLIFNRGNDRQSKTSVAFSIFSFAGFKPSNVHISNNDGVANSWIGNGDGSIGEGIYDDHSGKNIIYKANDWTNVSLSEKIWDKEIQYCNYD